VLFSGTEEYCTGNFGEILQRYLVWEGNLDQLIQDFSKYRGDSVDQIITTFKGVSVDGFMHNFM